MSVTIPIVSTPDVLGGKPRIEGTRVPVHQVGQLVREQGWERERVATEFDLTADEVEAAIEYYDDHPDEMAALVESARETYDAGAEQGRGSP